MMLQKILLIILLSNTYSYFEASAQKVNKRLPVGVFIQDSISIGLPVYYILTYQHSPETQLIFPDSAYNYAPFEFVRKTFFETRTQNNISVDSVVYTLQTFEINKVQQLALPVLIHFNKDSLISLFAKPDSIYLKELIKGNPQNESLKSQSNYQPIESQFNYPYWIAGFLFFLLLIFIIWGLLGKQIRRAIRLFRFRTRHAIFLNDFARLTNRITSRQSIDDIEKAIALWKKHLEQIENKPFSSYTSKEIIQAVPDKDLSDSLKSIDRAIYGKEISQEIGNALTILKNFSIFRFEKQKEVMRNA